jgi:hypothetical protein
MLDQDTRYMKGVDSDSKGKIRKDCTNRVLIGIVTASAMVTAGAA